MRQTSAYLIVALGLWVVARPLLAHHSFHGTYLLDKQVKLEGTIARLLFRNPHSYLEIDVPDEAGKAVRWDIEMGASLPLSKRGITQNTLNAGDQITITVSPARNPVREEHKGVLRTLRRPSDGFEWGTKPGEVVKEWQFD